VDAPGVKTFWASFQKTKRGATLAGSCRFFRRIRYSRQGSERKREEGEIAESRHGWGRVQAICDFVHQHIQFGYKFASPAKTAWELFTGRKGVCRAFAHLAITLCRCMNIPARYCTGYLVTSAGFGPNTLQSFRVWTDEVNA
jgi:transglutaminase-like putative cysteine protease